MNDGAPSQDEALVVIALNILSGKINPEQWIGLRRVAEDEAAVLNMYREIKQWGFGELKVAVRDHRLDMAYKSHTFKGSDLIKGPETP